jgi:DNA-binding transcriptional MerR regulator
MKRAGGRRYYRPDDVDLLRGIRHLLYGQGYTIRGVQRILREQGPKFVQAVWQPGAAQPTPAPADDAMEAQQLQPDEAARTLFGLLKSPEPGPVTEAPAPGRTAMPADQAISREHTRRLQAALHELAECRRLIDEVLSEQAA